MDMSQSICFFDHVFIRFSAMPIGDLP